MPDDSEPPLVPAKGGLKTARYPAWLEPIIPYRIEEWARSAAYAVPEGWSPQPGESNLPTVRRKAHPEPGSFAIYVGGNPLTPRPEFLPKEYRIVKAGYAYSEEEAHARANAWVRAHLPASGGKAPRRAKMKQAAGIPTSSSEPTSAATSAVPTGKPGA